MTDGDRCGTRWSRPLGWIAVGLVLAAFPAGCAEPVPGTKVAEDLADRFTEALGEEPDTREILERNNNMINRVSDTVQVRWTALDLGPDPLDQLAASLEASGLTVTYRSSDIPDGRPRSGGVDTDELEACLDNGTLDVGGRISAGWTEAGLEIVAEFGGPPASVGCVVLG